MHEPDQSEINSLRFSDIPRGSPKLVAAEKSPVRSIRPNMNEAPNHGLRSYLDDESPDDEEGAPLIRKSSEADNILNLQPMPTLHHNGGVESIRHSRHEGSFRFTGGFSTVRGSSQFESDASSPVRSVTELEIPTTHEADAAPTKTLKHKGHLPLPREDPINNNDQPTLPASQERILDVHRATLDALLRSGDSSKAPTPPPPTHFQRYSRLLQQSIVRDEDRSPTSTRAIRNVSLVPPPIDVVRSKMMRSTLPIPSPYPLSRTRPSPRTLPASPRSQTCTNTALWGSKDSHLPLSIRSRNADVRARRTSMHIPPPRTSDYSAVKSAPTPEKESHFRALDYDDAAFARELNANYTRLVGFWYRYLSARQLSRIVVSGVTSQYADRQYGWLSTGRSTNTITRRDVAFDEVKLLRLLEHPKDGRGRHAWVSWARRIADSCSQNQPAEGGARMTALYSPMASRQASASNMRSFSERLSAPPLPRSVSGAERGESVALSPGPVSRVGAEMQTGATGEGGRIAETRDPERSGMDGRDAEGLVFVLNWSIWRIVVVLAVVIFLAVATALLWIFLGPRDAVLLLSRPMTTSSGGAGGVSGVRGAGDRLGAGVALGICTLLLGLTATAGWLGISWLAV